MTPKATNEGTGFCWRGRNVRNRLAAIENNVTGTINHAYEWAVCTVCVRVEWAYLKGAWLPPPSDPHYKHGGEDESIEEVNNGTESVEQLRDVTNQDQGTSTKHLHTTYNTT